MLDMSLSYLSGGSEGMVEEGSGLMYVYIYPQYQHHLSPQEWLAA
jgi:hypothetical protein